MKRRTTTTTRSALIGLLLTGAVLARGGVSNGADCPNKRYLTGTAVSEGMPLLDGAKTLQAGAAVCVRELDPLTGTRVVTSPDSPNERYLAPATTLSEKKPERTGTPSVESDDAAPARPSYFNAEPLPNDELACDQKSEHCLNRTVPDRIPPGLEVGSGLNPVAVARTGGTFNGGEVMQPLDPSNLRALQRSMELSETASGLSLIDAAVERKRAVEAAASDDQALLSAQYQKMPLAGAAKRFEAAESYLRGAAGTLRGAVSGMNPGAKVWFGTTYQDAAEKAGMVRELLSEGQTTQEIRTVSPFAGLFEAPGHAQAEMELKVAALLQPEGTASRPTSVAALESRLVMLAALTDAQRKQIGKHLKLAEDVELQGADGGSVRVSLLHNGYILGGGRTAVDCSSFISKLISSGDRKLRLTTLDMRSIYELSLRGALSPPPRHEKEREQFIRRTAAGFSPVNVTAGDRLRSGDLLVYRLPWQTIGHVFLVRSYDPRSKVARVIEASESSSTITERDFSLSLEAPGADLQHVRPGVFGLRLSATDSSTCTYQSPAPRRKKGSSI